MIDNMVAENSYGTASALGGFSRLRSYSQGRYKGAHTLFFGSEIRWNLTEERKPFDIGIMKDVRTLLQLALFYEAGVTSDTLSDLSDHSMLRKIPASVSDRDCVRFRLRADMAIAATARCSHSSILGASVSFFDAG
jgi:hypothetical protein